MVLAGAVPRQELLPEIMMRAAQRFASVLRFTILSAAFCIWQTGAASAAPQLKAGSPCTPQTNLAVCFGAPPMPSQLQNIGFTAPTSGMVRVTVNGSGYCVFQDGTGEQTAEFETQITDNPNAVANHAAAGGLLINARLPKSANPSIPLTVPFNLNSSRTFTVAGGKKKNFILAGHAIQFDSHVACYGVGISMTVLFIPI
jgi:hypothetical protein